MALNLDEPLDLPEGHPAHRVIELARERIHGLEVARANEAAAANARHRELEVALANEQAQRAADIAAAVHVANVAVNGNGGNGNGDNGNGGNGNAGQDQQNPPAAQGDQAAAAAVAASRPLATALLGKKITDLRKFQGVNKNPLAPTESWYSWRNHAEAVIRLNSWCWKFPEIRDNVIAAMVAGASGTGAYVRELLDEDPSIDSAKQLLDLLEETFMPETEKRTMQRMFDYAQQMDNETLSALAERMRTLFNQCYPKEWRMEKILVGRFIQAIRDRAIAEAVDSREPQTLKQALKYALQRHSFREMEVYQSNPSYVPDLYKNYMDITAPQPMYVAVQPGVQTLRGQPIRGRGVGRGQAAVMRRPPPAPARSGQGCYLCGGAHLQRDCPSNRPLRGAATRGAPAARAAPRGVNRGRGSAANTARAQFIRRHLAHLASLDEQGAWNDEEPGEEVADEESVAALTQAESQVSEDNGHVAALGDEGEDPEGLLYLDNYDQWSF